MEPSTPLVDRALPRDAEKRNPNHHQVILALSTAFWDAWVRGDAAAQAWLDGDGPASVLEKNDRWQSKDRPAAPGESRRGPPMPPDL